MRAGSDFDRGQDMPNILGMRLCRDSPRTSLQKEDFGEIWYHFCCWSCVELKKSGEYFGGWVLWVLHINETSYKNSSGQFKIGIFIWPTKMKCLFHIALNILQLIPGHHSDIGLLLPFVSKK